MYYRSPSPASSNSSLRSNESAHSSLSGYISSNSTLTFTKEEVPSADGSNSVPSSTKRPSVNQGIGGLSRLLNQQNRSRRASGNANDTSANAATSSAFAASAAAALSSAFPSAIQSPSPVAPTHHAQFQAPHAIDTSHKPPVPVSSLRSSQSSDNIAGFKGAHHNKIVGFGSSGGVLNPPHSAHSAALPRSGASTPTPVPVPMHSSQSHQHLNYHHHSGSAAHMHHQHHHQPGYHPPHYQRRARHESHQVDEDLLESGEFADEDDALNQVPTCSAFLVNSLPAHLKVFLRQRSPTTEAIDVTVWKPCDVATFKRQLLEQCEISLPASSSSLSGTSTADSIMALLFDKYEIYPSDAQAELDEDCPLQLDPSCFIHELGCSYFLFLPKEEFQNIETDRIAEEPSVINASPPDPTAVGSNSITIKPRLLRFDIGEPMTIDEESNEQASLAPSSTSPTDVYLILLRAVETKSLTHLRRAIEIDGFSADARSASGWGALHACASSGQFHLLNYLLKHEADPDVTTHTGETPLHIAARLGHMDLVESLLCAGADASKLNIDGSTALQLASEAGWDAIVQLLRSAQPQE